ncbi:FAD-binding oxidoreductase [Aquipuribacter nitratireducens]|uniref:FAD-binding oxidoreductase n=1 Tax=Aquipuribacter nitratireducens TaxID=650104 RepID=UPI0030EC42D2
MPAGGAVLDSATSTERYRHDQAAWAEAGVPLAVVRPSTPEQVRDVVVSCRRHGVPVVPRGAGSGLAGGANAVDGGVVVSTERLLGIAVDPVERLAVVGPGVLNADLRATAAEHGLWYAPDPASAAISSIGGNVATNAGGLCCVKYGVTRDHVLAVQLVTGAGDLVRLGRRTAKGVAGLDLLGAVVGSEGTLGVVTEVTVRLRPARPPERTVAGFFGSLVDAGEAVAAVARAGVVPSALELMDSHCLRAVDAWKRTGLADEADTVLLARLDAPGDAGEAEAATVEACFAAAGATWAGRSSDEAEAEALFDARRLVWPAVDRLGPLLTEDVCVPVGVLPRMLERVQAVAREHRLTIATLAHVGDGNLHPLVVVPRERDGEARAAAAFEQIMDDALVLGGTITGEHGVGRLKREGLVRELDATVLDLQRRVKAAFDPDGIMNPGVMWR